MIKGRTMEIKFSGTKAHECGKPENVYHLLNFDVAGGYIILRINDVCDGPDGMQCRSKSLWIELDDAGELLGSLKSATERAFSSR